MAEQRYEAVRAMIADGETVKDVAARFGVSRKTVHVWLARYDAAGLDLLADRSHRPGRVRIRRRRRSRSRWSICGRRIRRGVRVG